MKTLRQSFHFGETEILFTDALIQLMSCDDGNSWSSGFVLPRSELPSKFPFPTPDGPELRDRPAYYYTQSAVIPFQRGKDGLTILLIGSSKRKHLVVPKGIHEPGLSAQDSAAIESMEEAGVRGPVSAKAIGSYSYAKWGAECTVTVYVQEVVELLTEEQWEESHRGRQWLVPEVAAARVKEPHLGRMIGRVEEFVNREFL